MRLKIMNFFTYLLTQCFLQAIIVQSLLQMSAGDVTATLNYHMNDGTRPFFYGYQREGKKEGELDIGGTAKEKEVVIQNGRLHGEISLDVHSFELENCSTSLITANFYEEDQQKIKKIYYKEMEECLKRKLGAERVVAMHHQLRNNEKNNGERNNIFTSIQGYAKGIHSDTHPESADFAWAYGFLNFSSDLDSTFYKGRYLYINLWRSIDDDAPIGKDPLAVLDQTSLTEGVGSEDYIEADFHGMDPASGYKYSMKQYYLNEKNSDDHRWFYFPNMTKDEVILFKQWDSDPEKPGRICFHTSFDDPLSSTEAPTRQSIEVRFIAYFPNHQPNTCPSKWMIYWLYVLIKVMTNIRQIITVVSVGAVAILWKWWRRKPSSTINKQD